MRLQRLELSGFKSFPDRSELAFDRGVTAIVGPNGCGKSNLVDAITWVLGEQSARSLRGDRMEDVIFSGSDARKPTGAAEVKLKLTDVTSSVPARLFAPRARIHEAPAPVHPGNGNGNGSGGGHRAPAAVAVGGSVELDDEPTIVRDVEVSRRLYRSGESEYLIDGEVCRLRDVHDLLMDAGVGVKAYAVIEQGKIGQILSARPTERRQLIEEAAGVTKYKSRRRAAELKLEAAQQNLTRIDDIVYEVEKQRSALKRQAAKARRHRRLREELRLWEKVVFAHRYRALAAVMDETRAQLAAAQARESAAAARLAEVEASLERLRIALAEADSRAVAAREAAHARELEIERRQQQILFDRQQVSALDASAAELLTEVDALGARREPTARALADKRAAAAHAADELARKAQALAAEETAYQAAYRELEGLESDVEAARSEVFSALNAATALRHAVDHASSARERIATAIEKLDVERADLEREADRAAEEHEAASGLLDRARAALETTRLACAEREAALAAARSRSHEMAGRCRALETRVAGQTARLASLEELDAARAEYGDAARLILAESNGAVGQLGSLADYLDVEAPYERAVEAWLGDLLQHVLVQRHEHAAAGLALVREQDAGRCGFLVVDPGTRARVVSRPGHEGLVAMAEVVQVNGPYRAAIEAAIGGAWVADTFEQAAAAAADLDAPVATLAGEVFRGCHLVYGGTKGEARGILATKRQIKELSARLSDDQAELLTAGGDLASLETEIAESTSAIEGFQAEAHRQEKAMVAFEARVARAREEAERVSRKLELVAAERRRAEEEHGTLELRQLEATESIARLESEQQVAEDRFTGAQRRLLTARELVEGRSGQVANVKAAHAALVERAAGLAAEVARLDEAMRDLEERLATRQDERQKALRRKADLEATIVLFEGRLDEDVRAFGDLKTAVTVAEEACVDLRDRFEVEDRSIREARRALESVRADLGRLEVARATAEGDLSHLAQVCLDTVQVGLDDVAREVARLEREGGLEVPRSAADEPDADEDADVQDAATARPDEGQMETMVADGGRAAPAPGADEMVARLKAKLERLGPVNMMAIEQFDDLESRHTFLTVQRKDLVDSIAATSEAIRRIDKTTRERFQEAFQVIDTNFGQTFTTLFGGGRAGLVLLDESDELESGIDIIAQPPGKRLQSVQLLSGGEKALTAMALMFALFKFRPSPFCLLDEIDAPLDDANIGRFVEMLQGMQDHTQFVLVTHNRKTMEIADRLYGVTMEEPGVSKLISVQLN